MFEDWHRVTSSTVNRDFNFQISVVYKFGSETDDETVSCHLRSFQSQDLEFRWSRKRAGQAEEIHMFEAKSDVST